LNRKKRSIGSNLLFCIKNTMQCHPTLLLGCLVFVMTNVGIPVLTTYFPKVVIERITGGSAVQNIVGVVLFFSLALAVLSGVKSFLEKYVLWKKAKVNAWYLRLIARKGMMTDYGNQEKEEFRKLQAESVQACDGNFSPLTEVYEVGVEWTASVLGFLTYSAVLTELYIGMVGFLIVTSLVGFGLNKRIVQWQERHNDEKIQYRRRIDYISKISGDLKSAKEIRLYKMRGWFEAIYQQNLQGIFRWYRRYSSLIFGVSVLDNGCIMLRDVIIYVYLIYLAVNGNLNIADFVLYFGMVTGFSVWLGGILGKINVMKRISLSVDYVRDYLEYPEQYRGEGGRKPENQSPQKIELKNVSYRYEGAEKEALSQINLTIMPGEHLAVVGLNGAGKTTLIKLLCGLTDPTDGKVLYDDIDVRDYDRGAYYDLFSAVFQQHSILPVEIQEMVAETTKEKLDTEKVKECLKKAGIWEKIRSLPGGLESCMGKTIHDDGVEFSGGEIQKLLFARALYRKAPVMILDEPNAALDPISESKLYETYDEVMKGHSAVFISHRLASTQFCDRILLIEDGKILEEGSHEELLKKKGRYFALYETQAKYYREEEVAE